MEIQLFNSQRFGQVRTAGDADNPLFCLADICRAVDLVNPSQVKARLDPEDVQLIDLHALNGGQEIVGNSMATFVNESGAYEVILFSNSPKVRPFRRWLTKEVIPSIRRTGGYSIQNLSRKELALMVVKAEEEKEALMLENKRKEEMLEEQKPKVLFADAVATAKQSCLIGELAKIICQNGVNIGQNRMFAWLRDHGYLGKCGQYYNIPTQMAMDMNLFEIKKNTVVKPDGSVLVTTTTKVTGKGQQYFINKFLGNGNKEN